MRLSRRLDRQRFVLFIRRASASNPTPIHRVAAAASTNVFVLAIWARQEIFGAVEKPDSFAPCAHTHTSTLPFLCSHAMHYSCLYDRLLCCYIYICRDEQCSDGVVINQEHICVACGDLDRFLRVGLELTKTFMGIDQNVCLESICMRAVQHLTHACMHA